MELISGFSKYSREEKISCLKKTLNLKDEFETVLAQYRHSQKQELFDVFSENTISNFILPFGVAPNFVINGKYHIIPMVTEESSVVAAASRGASFWSKNGGFNVTVHNTIKVGQIWFKWNGKPDLLKINTENILGVVKSELHNFTESMEKRGGGIKELEFYSQPELNNIWQLQVKFETADSMGANFINSCLEKIKKPLTTWFEDNNWPDIEILFTILSNYTPDCLVTCETHCHISKFKEFTPIMAPELFANNYKLAVDIAFHNMDRAVTHNKGIFNGIDAVIIATGNDYRAVEAAGHAYASRNGKYRSLSSCSISPKGEFSFSVTLPLAIGTIGGITNLHPMSVLALKILNNPPAAGLMGIAAAAGLANNFSAISSLVTTGIQHGHMKLHLANILQSFNATELEKKMVLKHFKGITIDFKAVKDFMDNLRSNKNKLIT